MPRARKSTISMRATFSGPGRTRTCTTPFRDGGSSFELQSQDQHDRQGSNLRRLAFQASALPLSYGHKEQAELESNQHPPAYQTGALPPQLSACGVSKG